MANYRGNIADIPMTIRDIYFWREIILYEMFNRYEVKKYEENEIENERCKYIRKNIYNINNLLIKYTKQQSREN